MITVVVDPEFQGPGLPALMPVVDDLTGPVEVAWSGSRLDHALLDRLEHRDLHLVAKDQDSAERLRWQLGLASSLPQETLVEALKSLAPSKDQGWRRVSEPLGCGRAAMLLTATVAGSIRVGKIPRVTAAVAIGVIHGETHPCDVDVLARVRALK